MTEHNRPSRLERVECGAARALQLGHLQPWKALPPRRKPRSHCPATAASLGVRTGPDQPPGQLQLQNMHVRWLEGGAGAGPACPHQATPPQNGSDFTTDKTPGSDGTDPAGYTLPPGTLPGTGQVPPSPENMGKATSSL